MHYRTLPGFIKIGSTGKARGISGEMKLYIDDGFIESLTSVEFLFIERHGNKVPFRIDELREVQDILVKFAGIDDPTAAEAWALCDVFIPGDEIVAMQPEAQGDSLEYDSLKGFHIIDASLGDIGTIGDIQEFPQQEMAVLHRDGKEILIPLNPVFILEIDTHQQVVRMQLPDGLLEI